MISELNFFHKKEIIKLNDCPPSSYVPCEFKCYRWVFDDINDIRNFQSQAQKNPSGLNDRSDLKKCEFYALSFHKDLESSKKHFDELLKLFKNIKKKLGTHIALGEIGLGDGLGGKEEKFSHFNFHFVSNCEFPKKFNIIEKLK